MFSWFRRSIMLKPPVLEYEIAVCETAYTITFSNPAYNALGRLVGSIGSDAQLTQEFRENGDITGTNGEWSITAVKPPSTLTAWVNYYDWDPAEDGPLQFVLLSRKGAPSIKAPRLLIETLVDEVCARKSYDEKQREHLRQESELIDWVSNLKKQEVDWANLGDDQVAQLDELEQEARSLDEWHQSDPPYESDDPQLTVRQTLLQSLHAWGLLDAAGDKELRKSLANRGFKTLLSYVDASENLTDYMESEGRREHCRLNTVVPVLASRLSLDWFRFGPYIGGIATSPHVWAGWAEHNTHRSTWLSHTGVSWWSSGSAAETFLYRMDNPFRAALVQCGNPVEALTSPLVETSNDPGPRLEQCVSDCLAGGFVESAILLLALRIKTEPRAASAWKTLGAQLRESNASALEYECIDVANKLLDTSADDRFDATHVSKRIFTALGLTPRRLADSVTQLPEQLVRNVALVLATQESDDVVPCLLEVVQHSNDSYLLRYVVKRLSRWPTAPVVQCLQQLSEQPEKAAILGPYLRWSLDSVTNQD